MATKRGAAACGSRFTPSDAVMDVPSLLSIGGDGTTLLSTSVPRLAVVDGVALTSLSVTKSKDGSGGGGVDVTVPVRTHTHTHTQHMIHTT